MADFTLFSPYSSIYMNLALEQILARSIQPGKRILLFWTNEPSLVFGRFQNPWAECSIGTMESLGIIPARRYSGGGTVYHDPGNLNYSVITDRQHLDIQDNLRLLADALHSQGLKADIGPRRDLLVGLHKISGSAFQVHRDFAVHHGTLLVNADLDRIRTLLTNPFAISDSRSVGSVSSRVTNIGEATGIRDPKVWASLIRKAFSAEWGGFSDIPIPLPDIMELSEKCNDLSRWEWVFGQTPPFTLTLSSDIPYRLTIDRGRITSVLQRDAPGSELKIPAGIPLTKAGLEELAAAFEDQDAIPFTTIKQELNQFVIKEAYHVI